MEQMNRLVELRTKHHLSKRKLAEAVGVSHITVMRAENAQRKLSIPQAVAFSDYFGVSVDYLLGASAEESFSRFVKSYDLDRVCDADLLAKFRAVVSSVDSDKR